MPVARLSIVRGDFWLGVLCAAVLSAAPAAAWELVGFQQARFSDDLDTTSVEVVRLTLRENHKQLLLCAEQRPLHLREAEVILTEGSRHSITLARLISSGACTEAIDLDKIKPNIKEIIIHYDRPPGLAPIIKVYAR